MNTGLLRNKSSRCVEVDLRVRDKFQVINGYLHIKCTKCSHFVLGHTYHLIGDSKKLDTWCPSCKTDSRNKVRIEKLKGEQVHV